MKGSAPAFATPRRSLAVLFMLGLGLASTSAFAEYKLQSGDTLEISVVGIPALKQRSLIGLEGEISLPLDGQIKVSGLSVTAAGAKIAQDLSNKIYRQSSADGREIPYLILPDEVVVTVAEYRPIYVNGDVAKPGEYMFRPGITVRQAVAVAGGYGLTQFGVTNPYLQAADLRAEYETLSTEFAREQARSWRLRTETAEPGFKSAGNEAPLAVNVSQRFMKAENQQHEARIADHEKDTAFLRTAIAKADLQLSALAEKKKENEAGNRADLADFEKIKELYQKGLSTVMRLSEARRVELLSSGQLLQTIVDVSNIERQRGDYARQLEKLSSQSRVDDLKELDNTELHLVQIAARLKSTGEKMAYVGLMKSQLTQGTGSQPTVTVYRIGDNGPEYLTARDSELRLAPGDVVDVALPNDRIAEILPPPNKALAVAGAQSSGQ
jgi:polysaccharide export outer membrane protein